MKQLQLIITVLLIIVISIIAVTLVVRRSVCDIHFRNGSLEVAVHLDCKSAKVQ
ncbi:MAG TPA: Hok/Gef family protein [Scandinavium sp.]|jgi:protein HokB|uniref:Hok/Gef family protein n=1 Tax=Scandinavium sp. TaxID=2830653 RepID=UPI002E342D25|nr:Hok/Gef family protein [Scandinavium sp.]HEX4503058.1 Hok/Gef family protein [Scandinavium sp.]